MQASESAYTPTIDEQGNEVAHEATLTRTRVELGGTALIAGLSGEAYNGNPPEVPSRQPIHPGLDRSQEIGTRDT